MRSYAPVLAFVTLLPSVTQHLIAQERTHHTFRYSTSAKTMAFSPDSTYLAVSAGGNVDFIAPRLGRSVRQYKAAPFSMGFSNDIRHIYMISRGSSVRLNLQTDREYEPPDQITPGYLGFALKEENGKLLVKSIYPGSPVEALGTIKVDDELLGVATGRHAEMKSVVGWKAQEVYNLLNDDGFVGTYVQLKILPKGRVGEQNAKTHLVRRWLRKRSRAGYIYQKPTPVETDQSLVRCINNGKHEFRSASTGLPVAQLETIDISNDRGAFVVSPDGTHFAGVSRLNGSDSTYAVEVFDIGTQERLALVALSKGPCSDIAFSPDNAHVLVAARDSVEIVDIAAKRVTGRLTLGWNARIDRYVSPPFGKEGSTDITGATFQEVADGSEFDQALANRPAKPLVSKLAISSNGLVATADNSGHVKLWNLNSGELLHELPKNAEEKPNAIAFSPDGRWLAFHVARVTHVVDVSDIQTDFSGTVELHPSKEPAPKGFQRPTPADLAPQPVDDRLKLVIMTRPPDGDDDVCQQFIAFSPTGDTLYVGCRKIGVIPERPQLSKDSDSSKRNGGAEALATNAPMVVGGTISAGRHLSNAVAAYRVVDGKQLRAYQPTNPRRPGKWLHCETGTLSHDGKYLALLTEYDGIYVYESSTGRLVSRIRFGAPPVDMAFRAGFLQDSASLLTVGNGIIRMYETATGKLEDVERLTRGLDVNPYDDRIVTARNANAFTFGTAVFDSQTAQLISPNVEKAEHSTVGISANGELILGVYQNCFAVYRGECHQLDVLDVEPYVNDGYFAGAISDYGRLCAASSGSTIVVAQLLDTEGKLKPRLLETLEGHLQLVEGLAFSRDRKLLASTSTDGSTRIWNIADLGQ